MKVGLCTVSNEAISAEATLELAAATGYDGVEIWGKEPGLHDSSAAVCESIQDAATELSLEIPVYGSYLFAGTDSFDDEYEQELAITERLGADAIRVWPGESEYDEHSESEWDAVVTDLRRLAERAADLDVAVTVEKHEGRLTNCGEGARRLIKAVDRPNCRLNWQPLFSLSERELQEEAEMLASISNNVHIQAPAERGGDRRSLLEDAYFDVEAILDQFEAAGFDGHVEVEFVTSALAYEDAIQRDLNYLRSIL